MVYLRPGREHFSGGVAFLLAVLPVGPRNWRLIAFSRGTARALPLLKNVIRASRAHHSCERSLFSLIIHATIAFQCETTFLWGVAHALRSNCDFGQFDVVSRMLSTMALTLPFSNCQLAYLRTNFA